MHPPQSLRHPIESLSAPGHPLAPKGAIQRRRRIRLDRRFKRTRRRVRYAGYDENPARALGDRSP